MFKVGDYVIILENSAYYKATEICQVKHINGMMWWGEDFVRLKSIKPSFKKGEWSIETSKVEKILKPSKLNKKLYPSYIEHNGFLVPADLWDRMKKERNV